MDSDLVISAIAIVALLFFSGFFSGSETALTAASRARMHRMAVEGSRRALRVRRLLEDPERLIGGILLGNNLVNILASALATSLFISLFGDTGVVYATLAMTTLVVIFAEVLPKSYAISNPDRMALVVAPVIVMVIRVFAPVVSAVQAVVRATLHIFGIDIEAQTPVLSAKEEIRGVVDLHASEGALVKAHRDMLGGILELEEVLLEDVMIHRRSMAMINADLSASQVVDAVVASPHTRLPLWKDNIDNIVGVLHAKDVLRALKAAGGDADKLDIAAIMTDPWFVPETTTLREQLNAFLERRAHFALVVDEYGTLMGLITLEDILEEIVGEISDEYDIAARGIKEETGGSVVVEGTTPIRDINRLFDWNLPDEEATTIAGLVIHVAETIPRPGETFEDRGFRFEVMRRQRNQITAVRIVPPPASGNKQTGDDG